MRLSFHVFAIYVLRLKIQKKKKKKQKNKHKKQIPNPVKTLEPLNKKQV